MLTISIQAGGESRRMGQDKALIPFLGRPLIQRVIERLAPIADEVLVTTNNPDAYRFLGLPLFPDLRPGRGALGGLYTAMSAASQPYVAIVACDMPFASAELLSHALSMLIEQDYDVVIPATEKGLEPLHAIFRRAACLPAIEQALDADLWRLISWFSQVRVRELTVAETARFDPDGLVFWNLNTPEELVAAEDRARGLGEA